MLMGTRRMNRPPALAGFALALGCVVALTGCTGSPAPAKTSAATAAADRADSATGIRPGYDGQSTLSFTPLIIDALADEVTPVHGDDGRWYAAYELRVINAAPRDAVLTGVETLDGDENGKVISSWDRAQTAANTMLLGTAQKGSAAIPAGGTAIIVIRDVYPSRESVPAAFTHRIAADFAAPGAEAPRTGVIYPEQVAQIGGALRTSTAQPIVIGPPLAGDDWVSNNALDPLTLNPHSDVVIPVGGRLTGAERYAIDFLRMDRATVSAHVGDPTQNSSYLAFDQPLLAVADATVVRVIRDQPDVAPGSLAPLTVLDDVTGNQIILDLGGGVYALYAHMKQGSATVAEGDTVVKGQEIGRLGNSGNTSEAHLHFQLQRGPLMSAENVPWVIDSYTSGGMVSTDGTHVLPVSGSAARSAQVPVLGSVSDFPVPGS